MSTYEIPLFLSSDTGESSNIINKSTDGSKFSVIFNSPLQIPENAKNIKTYVNNFKFWYSFKNVSSGKLNNKIYITATANATNDNQYTEITIEDGLYSDTALSGAISYALTRASLPSDAIVINGEESTGKIIITVKTGYQVYFKSTTKLNELLGFNSGQKVPSLTIASSNYVERGPNVAQFSSFSNVLLHASYVSKSLYNGRSSDVLCAVSPSVGVGEQMSYEPKNLIKIPCPNLVGVSLNDVTISITDQNNKSLDTNGENFYCVLMIEYTI